MRVCDLGAGGRTTAQRIWPDAEIVTVDVDPAMEPDVVADVRDLPEDLGKFHAILAAHLLEHIPRPDVVAALEHWREHLAADGEIHIIVPDLAWAAEKILRNQIDAAVMMHIYGSQTRPEEFHHFGYTVLLLRDLLQRAGYVVVHAETGPYGIVWPPDSGQAVQARQIYARAVPR